MMAGQLATGPTGGRTREGEGGDNAEPVVAPLPRVGERAPRTPRIAYFPSEKHVLVVFLRHAGDPCGFALFFKLRGNTKYLTLSTYLT